MNFPDFLKYLKVKNPTLFKGEKIQISIKSLENILKYTYSEGFKEGKNDKSLFENIFGKL